MSFLIFLKMSEAVLFVALFSGFAGLIKVNRAGKSPARGGG